MKQYIAKDGESLEMICFKIYGSLDKETLSQFLRENESLLLKFKLNAGDEVNIPQITKQSQRVVKYLWD